MSVGDLRDWFNGRRRPAGRPASMSTRQPPRAGYAPPVLQLALSGLVGLVTTVIWAATGWHYYWPAWVWLGLGIALGLGEIFRFAFAPPPRHRHHGVLVHASISGLVGLIVLVVWALAGAGTPFWPLWPLAALAFLLGLHAILAAVPRRAREEELEVRVDELTRTRSGALDVQAAELRRIERDLHDGAQARLVALSLLLGRTEERLEDRPDEAALVRSAREEAGQAIAELRDLARGISPPVLADRGLAAAVEALALRAALPVTIEADLPRRPPPVVETAAYFVVAEALTNAAKHAPGAAAHVRLALDHALVVEIADTGPGGADPRGGGLTGLRRRVEALDGRMTVTSPPGGGTTIRAVLPCER